MPLSSGKYRVIMGITLAAATLAGAVLFALERHAALGGIALITVGFTLVSAVTGLTERYRWLLPLLFWTALSLPVVKHFGQGDGLPAINADHLIVYPVDVVILIGLASALVSNIRTGNTAYIDKKGLVKAAAELFKPDLMAWVILAAGAVGALSIYPAAFRAPAAFALLDAARIYAVYVLFRRLAVRGVRPVLFGLLTVAAAQSLLCAVELFSQHNFGLWQDPGWARFIIPGKIGGWKQILVARCGGTFGPNVTAQFFQVVLPFGAVFFLAAGKAVYERRAKYFLLLILTVFALFATFSRGGWLGGGTALAVLVIAAWFKRKKVEFPSRSVVALITLGVILLLPAVAVIACRESAGDSLGTATRLEEWSTALAMIKDHPLLGVGKGNYVELARLSKPWTLRYPVHNVYLLFWAETGLVGFLAFAALLFTSFWFAARAFRDNTGSNGAFGLAALGAFAGLAVRMFVSMSFIHPLVNLTFIAIAATVARTAADFTPAEKAAAAVTSRGPKRDVLNRKVCISGENERR